MGIVRLNEWSKGDKASVFVNSVDGTRLGRLDLVTHRVWIDSEEHRNEVATRLVAWAAQNPDKFLRVPVGAGSPSSDIQPFEDLALRQPAEGLRAKVDEERAKIRARSRGWAFADRLIGEDGVAGPWLRGIKGERMVARVLARLERRAGWRVLHSVPLPGGGDIDHLLVGVDGVIAINTKYHHKARMSATPRAIYVRGARTEYLDDARDMARRASRALSTHVGKEVPVLPCVTLVNGPITAPPFETMGLPDDVIVATRWNLPRALWDASAKLSAEEVETIYQVARRSTTWV